MSRSKTLQRQVGNIPGFCLAIVVALAFTRGANAQAIQETLHVSVSDAASDTNRGSLDRPLKTIGEAVRRAVANKKASRGTRVVVHPGIYREPAIEFGYTNYPGNDPTNMTPIVIEAHVFGEAIVSGSDVWTGWEAVNGTRQYRHAWTYDWGAAPNPWAGARDLALIGRRREMIFVDGAHVRQVLSRSDLHPGSFFVDEPADLVYIDPPEGVDIKEARVDVAVRDRLWDQNYEGNVTIRGLVFEHAATPWADARAAVRIASSSNVVLEDVEIRWTNWQGLYLGNAEGTILRRVRLNHHGGQGWGIFRARDLLVEDSETSFNNWRGAWAGFTGWSVGNKLLSVHGLTIRRHKAVSNESRGLWIDYDIEDVILDSLHVADNRLDGVWLEANKGPVTVRSSLFERNGASGLVSTFSTNVVVDRNRFVANREGQIRLGGSGPREIENFETKESYTLRLRGWVITHNYFEGRVHLYTAPEFRREDWRVFVEHLVSDENQWVGASRGFHILRERWDLATWRARTAQDARSAP